MIRFLLSLIICLSLSAATHVSDGTRADVQAKIDAAVDGDIVTIPTEQTNTWTSGVTISGKGIHLQGAGSGRIVGRSQTSVTVGTGTKTFTLNASGLPISAGDEVCIWRLGGRNTGGTFNFEECYMRGTVNSYSGTSLEMDITSTASSGTHDLWIVGTESKSAIINNAGSGTIVSLTEDTTHHVELSGIRFIQGTGTGANVAFNRTTGGKIIKMHDCWVTIKGGGHVFPSSNRGLIWNCSFDSPAFSAAALAIDQVCSGVTDSWTTAATWGADDTTGTGQLYVEDCDFHAFLNATDNSMNARSVYRYCLFNHAGFGTHGADTGDWGQRYFEFYKNETLFVGGSTAQTMPMNQQFYIRGGTFIVCSNIITDINSTAYGNKDEYNVTVMNLQRNGGPNPCWGANNPGIQYPCPRQVGMGRVTGAAGNDSITYIGDSEPAYVWANTGTYVFGLSDYGGVECTNPDSTVDYVVEDRDYFLETAKPSYVSYAYPHPLRGEEQGGTTTGGKGRGQKGSGGRGRLR